MISAEEGEDVKKAQRRPAGSETSERSPLKKRSKKIDQLTSSDMETIPISSGATVPMAAIHIDDLTLIEVQRQLMTFDRVRLTWASRRLSTTLADQGKDIELSLQLLTSGNDTYLVVIRSRRSHDSGGSMQVVLHEVGKKELRAFFKAMFVRLKQLRSITISDDTPAHAYHCLLNGLKMRNIGKIRRLVLDEAAHTRDRIKCQLIRHCAAHLRFLVYHQSTGRDSANLLMRTFEECTSLHSLIFTGSLAPNAGEFFKKLSKLRWLTLRALPKPPIVVDTFPLAGVFKDNSELRHLLLDSDWLKCLAAPSTHHLVSRLKSISVYFTNIHRSLKHLYDALQAQNAHIRTILSTMADDSYLYVSMRFAGQLVTAQNRNVFVALLVNFFGGWLQLASDTGRTIKLFFYDSADVVKRLTNFLMAAIVVDRFKRTFPTVAISKTSNGSVLIRNGNGRLLLLSP